MNNTQEKKQPAQKGRRFSFQTGRVTTVAIPLADEVRARLDELAVAEGTSRASVARRLIVQGLGGTPQTQEPA